MNDSHENDNYENDNHENDNYENDNHENDNHQNDTRQNNTRRTTLCIYTLQNYIPLLPLQDLGLTRKYQTKFEMNLGPML